MPIIYKLVRPNNFSIEHIKDYILKRKTKNVYIDNDERLYILRVYDTDYFIKSKHFEDFMNYLENIGGLIRINSKEEYIKFLKGEGIYLYIVNVDVYNTLKSKKKKRKKKQEDDFLNF